jgi:Na+/H+-dicarboxylate symporter
MTKTIIWIGALVVGAVLGLLGLGWLNDVMNFIATVYTRLFQLLAVPTIVLAVITTFATFGSKGSGRIFGRTLIYTLLTTFTAAAVGALLYVVVAPSSLPEGSTIAIEAPSGAVGGASYLDHILSVIPNNIIKPFLEGNVLSLLLLAFAVGIGLSKLPESENMAMSSESRQACLDGRDVTRLAESKAVVVKGLLGLQDLLFLLIRGLIWTLPLGIVAFSAQLSAQVSAGVVADSIGKYVLVVLGGNVIQFFVVLPLFLLARGLNPIHVLGKMMPAVLMALFTKSSAATLPVTMESAENRLGVRKDIARFVLPICTTINMNGCAAFILVTSLFVMQNGGTTLTLGTILLWLLISVVSAVGNAGVPMGCFFLTLSLMSGIGAPVAILGIILPIYTIIDMVETAENVWSDSCVCAMTDHDI